MIPTPARSRLMRSRTSRLGHQLTDWGYAAGWRGVFFRRAKFAGTVVICWYM